MMSLAKFKFEIETTVGTKYSNSPCYVGSQQWDKLALHVLSMSSINELKSHLGKTIRDTKDNIVYIYI